MAGNGGWHLERLRRQLDTDGWPARGLAVDTIKGVDREVGEHATIDPGHRSATVMLDYRGVPWPGNRYVGRACLHDHWLEEERDGHRRPNCPNYLLVIALEPVVGEVPGQPDQLSPSDVGRVDDHSISTLRRKAHPRVVRFADLEIVERRHAEVVGEDRS